MSLNSVNTNIGAMVALQSLNRTNEALNATQKRVSTGYRVSDAKDDGAAFAVALRGALHFRNTLADDGFRNDHFRATVVIRLRLRDGGGDGC